MTLKMIPGSIAEKTGYDTALIPSWFPEAGGAPPTTKIEYYCELYTRAGTPFIQSGPWDTIDIASEAAKMLAEVCQVNVQRVQIKMVRGRST